MAQENITKFMEKFAADESLREKLNGKSADEVISIAHEMGFEFDKQELIAYRDRVMELDPDQLENAAGGSSADFERAADKVTNAIAYGIETAVNGVADAGKWVGEKAVVAYCVVKEFFSGIGSWF